MYITMKALALVVALLAAPPGLTSHSGDSFDPTTAPLSELVHRHQPPRPESRSTGLRLKQATRAGVIERLARRREHAGQKRQAVTSPGVVVCIPDTTAATTTPKYAVLDKVSVVNNDEVSRDEWASGV